ncbi:hypothetical protein [Paraburkholderia sp. BL21I4N1]|uniref:hypothetical protein n=1 Tax=Paraburkholderia sp. BL21I4N1 TaxID=1938801 RepID=UPI000CFCEB41|nr:hypothetical protein [Paraburkholderia sp. BL21I4N1]PQV50960.1 hypothetical protein B0G83_105323 [Paraburkholderia sp. BL21I4N1]
MTAGFQAFTDSGLVQIDGATSNYVLRQTLAVTAAAGTFPMMKSNGSTQYTAQGNVCSFSVSAVSPLIVLYSPNAYATILKVTNPSGNTWNVLLWASAAAQIAVYIFDRSAAAAPSGAGYGLQVFDESGTLIADARQRMARVIDVQAGNVRGAGPGFGQLPHVDTVSYSWNYPTVSKIGVGAIGTSLIGMSSGSTGNYNISALQTAGNAVNFLYQYYSFGGASHPSNDVCFGSQWDWRFMAVDLSNI